MHVANKTTINSLNNGISTFRVLTRLPSVNYFGGMFMARKAAAIIEIEPRKSSNKRHQASQSWRAWSCSIRKGILITAISVGQ